jgi:hypothetical protein
MTTPSYSAGKSGFGQAISGGYGRLTVANLLAIKGNIWTVEGWIKIASNPPANRVAFGQGNKVWVGAASDGRLIANYRTTGDVFINAGANPVITDDTWHHVRVSSNELGAYLFLDGILLGTSLTPATINPGNSDFAFNNFAPLLSSQWPGQVDEVAIWATTKSTSDFTAPTAPYVGNEPGLALVYSFENDGTGRQAA